MGTRELIVNLVNSFKRRLEGLIVVVLVGLLPPLD